MRKQKGIKNMEHKSMGSKNMGSESMESKSTEILSYCMKSHKEGRNFIRSSQAEDRLAFLSEGSLEQGKEYYLFTYTCACSYELGLVYAAAHVQLPLCESIEFNAYIVDTETENFLYHMGTKRVKSGSELSADFTCKTDVLQGKREDQVIILMIASWDSARDFRPEWAARLGYLTEEPFDKPVVVHPQKQENYITYGDADWAAGDAAKAEAGLAGGLIQNGRETGEEGTINIALYREPDKTSDLDYLCKFGKDPQGNPNLTVPSEGSVSLKAGNYFEVTDVTARCYLIYKQGNGGYRLASAPALQDPNQNISVKVINNVVVWDDKNKWDNSFLYGGGWTEYVFDYLLDILITCRDRGGVSHVYRRQVTSLPLESEYDTTISPISIMWGCVAENTAIRMEDGSEKKIQDVKIGDRIRTRDGSAEVINIWKGEESNIIRLQTGGKNLYLTGNHPVLSREGWKRAENMAAADAAALADGGYAQVDAVEKEYRPVTVYNLSCEGGRADSMIAEGVIVGNMEAQNNPGIFQEGNQ